MSHKKTKEAGEQKNFNSGRQITKVEANQEGSNSFLALDYQTRAIIPSALSLELALGMDKSRLDSDDSINGDPNSVFEDHSTNRRESRLKSIEPNSISMNAETDSKMRKKGVKSSLSYIAGRRYENKPNFEDTSHQRSTEMSMYAVDYYKKQQGKYIKSKKVYN